jgi:hypothetical protein
METLENSAIQQNFARNSDMVSTTISTIVVQGGPLQLVIALLKVRRANQFMRETKKPATRGFINITHH